MDFTILKELGPWGIAVLVGVMGATQAIKPLFKKSNIDDGWLAFGPAFFAAPGVIALCIAKQIEWLMAPLVWFVVSFTGPIIYMYIIKPALKRKKRELDA